MGTPSADDASKRAQRLLSNGRYLRIDANLCHFCHRYEEILAEGDADERWTDAARGGEFRRRRTVCHAYIERARDRVSAAVARLAELGAIREEKRLEVHDNWKEGPR